MFKKNKSSNVAVANLTEAQKKKYFNLDNMNYFKQLKNFHEMQEVKAKNVAYRNRILQRQKISNYHNELDRVRGELSKTTLGGVTHNIIKKREDELKEMIKNIN